MKTELKEFTVITDAIYIDYFIRESKDIKACSTIGDLIINTR